MTVSREAELLADMERLVQLSEEFLQLSGSDMNYEKVAEDFLKITGAKYAGFNLFDADGKTFRTVAIAGDRGVFRKASKMLGFDIEGKKWVHDPVRAKQTASSTITRFASLGELTSGAIPGPVVSLLEKGFNIGEVVIVKILRKHVILGDFTLIMEKGDVFRKDVIAELYTRQLGMVIVSRQMEASLHESEERYRLLSDVPMEGIIIHKNGIARDVNLRLADMLGYKREELINKNVMELIAEDDRGRVQENIVKDYALPYQVRATRKNGEMFFAELEARNIRMNGETLRVAAVRDITERRRTEEALRQSEERFRSIMASMQDTVFTLDRQQRHTGVYGPWVENSGLTPEYFLGKTVLELMGEASSAVHRAANEKALAGEFVIYDWSMPAEGSLLYYQTSLSPILSEDGEVREIVGVGRNVTQHKLIEEKIRERETYLQTILHTTVDGLWVTDSHSRIIEVNDAYCHMSGYSRDELLGLSIFDIDISHTEISAVTEARSRRIIQNGSETFETRHSRKDGTVLDVEVSISCMRGSAPLFVCFGRDITARKQAEAALRESEKKYRLLVTQMDQGLSVLELILDEQGEPVDFLYLDVNDSFERLTNRKRDDIIGTTMRKMLPWVDDSLMAKYVRVAMGGKPIQYERFSDQAKKFLDVVVYSPRDKQIAIVISDITERRHAEEQIRYLSYRDQLTGLYNRRFYEEELKRLDTSRNLPLTVAMGDVNGLKLINDTLGHAVGDELIRAAAAVITEACRADDIIARMGGDEFVILLPKTDTPAALQIIERIKKLASQRTVGSMELSIAFGCETKTNAELHIQNLLKNAEDYMYGNKTLMKTEHRPPGR